MVKDADLKEVVAERLAGKTWRELAEKTRIPLSTLRKLVRAQPGFNEPEAGGSVRTYVPTSELHKLPEIRAVLEGRMKPHEAAQHFEVNLGTLENRLRKVRAAAAEGKSPSSATQRATAEEGSEGSDTSNIAPVQPQMALLPLISWVRAGDWDVANDYLQPGDAEGWYYCPRPTSQSSYVLKVRGDSMTAPSGAKRSYPEGSLIFVDPEKRAPVNGDRIIAKLEGSDEVTFKVYKNEDGRQWLMPLNPQHEPIRDSFKVIGTVIGMWMD
jgi:SOS-response transcriptional repressor LexA